MNKSSWITVLVVVAAISLTINLFNWFSPANDNRYPLLAKRLFVSNPNDLLINFTDLRSQLRDYTAKKKGQKIGIYFEYLPTGVSININGNEDFYRASLVKLPGVMHAYRLIEEGKLSKNEMLEVKSYHINQFGETSLQVGMKKTVAELARLSLRDSDNTAYEVLYEKVNGDILQKAKDQELTIDSVYNYLDIPVDRDGQTLFISPKNYSSVLKSLYFSSYLTYESSSELLGYLAESGFNKWLAAGLPEDITLANKYGVFDLDKPKEFRVHSDCGIIYKPKRPYLLCVMAQHPKSNTSAEEISDISKIVYDWLSK